jgi:hypothetical protein
MIIFWVVEEKTKPSEFNKWKIFTQTFYEKSEVIKIHLKIGSH